MEKYELYEKIDIRLYDELAKKFLKAKDECGFKTSTAFIESMIEKQSIYINFFRWIMNERIKQGTNLNQIAKKMNSSHASKEAIEQVIEMDKKQDLFYEEVRNFIKMELSKNDNQQL